MSESWKRWQGYTVDGKFPLQSYLGVSDHSAVFLTVGPDSAKAAIKLIAADPADAEKRLLRWKMAGEVTHPNLIRIFAMGRCELEGTDLLYLVMEFAEENLAQIIPERALTADEVKVMLPPMLQALQNVHDKGYVLGRIQPSNILAIGDQVKLADDALSMPSAKGSAGKSLSAGLSVYDPPETATGVVSAAGDVWQLGMTLVEVLTQRLPVWDRSPASAPQISTAVPEPFRGIVEYCLRVDPQKRWTVAQISNSLERAGASAPTPNQTKAMPAAVPVVAGQSIASPEKKEPAFLVSSQQKASAKWPYFLALVAIVIIAIVLIAKPKASSPAENQSSQTQQNTTADTTSAPTSTPATTSPSTSASTTATTGVATSAANADESGVVRRVMPEVSPAARRSIHGNIIVKVKVRVDDAGNVQKATIESGRGGKYFSRVALDSARDWKFVPAQAGESGTREWKLQFAFSRAKTDASAVRGKH
jgi:TonB family protein